MSIAQRRFGRNLPIPSTRQILHEYRAFAAQEDAKRKLEADKAATPRAEAVGSPKLV